MTQIVEPEILDLGILKSRVKSLLWFQNRVTGLSAALKDVFSLFVRMRLQQSLADNLIHRDVARLAALGLGDDQTVAAEINLPPFQVG
jgi:hypothetical protein